MAMRYNRVAVLCGALLALFLMTGISTAFGSFVPSLLPTSVTHILITILFFFFGVKLLYDAYTGEDNGENEEQAEVEHELNELHSKFVKSKGGKTKETTIEYTDGESPDALQRKTANTFDLESTNGSSQENEKCVNHIEQVASKLVFW
mmetsp:Transcript_2509/g.2141  ORF Transcript_2509/g.2141 Transcript_2509/m.2141 type:complete len:148 (-) Transcript_2509:322-765(-)